MSVEDLSNGMALKKVAWDNGDVENDFKAKPYQQMQELEKFLRKLQIPMALFGIYYMKQGDTIHGKGHKGSKCTLVNVYNFCVLLCFWIVFFKYVVVFFVEENNSEHTILRIIAATWGFQVAVNATAMLKASHPRFGNADIACWHWKNKILPALEKLNVGLNVSQIRRHLIKVTIVGWFFITFNVSTLVFLFFFPHTVYYERLPQVVISPFPVNNFTKVITLVILIYKCSAWIFPMLHCAALCTILNASFKCCRLAIEQANRDTRDHKKYPRCLFRERTLHLDICRVVEVFDRDLKYIYANLCLTLIPMACFLLYQLINTNLDLITTLCYMFWLSSNLLVLAITCSYAANMNKAAHCPLDCIYETGTKGITLDQIGQVNFFLSKLTAFSIGFTVLDFFVITKEFILTTPPFAKVVLCYIGDERVNSDLKKAITVSLVSNLVGGIFLTYSFVLLQF